MNDHQYLVYEQNFLSYFRGWRSENGDVPWVKQAKAYPAANSANGGARPDVDVTDQHIMQIIRGFASLGVHGIMPADLPKVLPPEPYEVPLSIMASVCAYFQGQYTLHIDHGW